MKNRMANILETNRGGILLFISILGILYMIKDYL